MSPHSNLSFAADNHAMRRTDGWSKSVRSGAPSQYRRGMPRLV
jgi:hypothetical protein